MDPFFFMFHACLYHTVVSVPCSLLITCWERVDLCDVSLLVGFVALRPKSTAMVIAGRSVHLTTLFSHTFSWAGLNKRLTSNLCTYFRL